MMFAVAIGEVGIRSAVLVRAHDWVHFLPAYSHLLLATIVIAASWVGWSRSPSPGARKDVHSVFEWEFVILLLDVLLVIVYFILVSLVDYTGESEIQLNASARPEASWIVGIFWLYLLWDCLSKINVYRKEGRSEPWLKNYGVRFIPTLVCLALAYLIKHWVQDADAPHVLSADLALIGLVLLFRALKHLASTLFPPPAEERNKEKLLKQRWSAVALSAFWALVILIGVLWTHLWPIPYVTDKIQTASSLERSSVSTNRR
jgi:hypothetical protein